MTRVIRGALLALPLLLAVALTGCGQNGDDTQVASAGGTKTPTAGASSTLSPQELGVKYAQCMRQHGVDMPDPKPGQRGVRFTAGPGTDKRTTEKAMEACRKYSPQANQSPGQQKKAQERQQKYAACMRENGVEDFPDPKPGQQGVKIDKKVADDPDFKAAEKACRDTLSGGGD